MQQMLEQKNRLAYEKGRLEKKVEQLQLDLESRSSMEAELNRLKKCHKVLEAKYTKVCGLDTSVFGHVCVHTYWHVCVHTYWHVCGRMG